MARQRGIMPVEGTIGNVTFFKSRDGYMVREKGGVSKQRIANDPAFERTRENNAEFSSAGKASKLLRTAFRPIIKKASDHRMVSRLTALMFAVLRQDLTNPRGMRKVTTGDLTLVHGFEFNLHGKLTSTFFAPYTLTIDRVTGNVEFALAAFIPTEIIASPVGTSHLRFTLSAAEIDFDNKSFSVESTESAFIDWSNQAASPVNLSVQLPAASTKPLFALFVVEFLQDVNNVKYSLKNGAFNACAVVKVDTP
jgi:hypothetical protein